ncbi:MAG TPA: M15 family metallopeptidase [Pyrinomonadaceae bacterium]|jgi:peptidoglycan L-alanyl-D-glutamate endopeptidase CwlK
MSSRLFEDDVTFLQRLLRQAGFYMVKIDGDWGDKTDKAVDAFETAFAEIADRLGTFHPRTEANLHTLHPKVQEMMRTTLKTIRDEGINARVISGTRTYAEQNKLFAQGRFGNKGKVVTNARGGQSNHNFGLACDIGIFTDDGAYLGESPLYAKAGKIVTGAGINHVDWGGNWKKFTDRPHYQFLTGLTITDVRTKFENGKAIFD